MRNDSDSEPSLQDTVKEIRDKNENKNNTHRSGRQSETSGDNPFGDIANWKIWISIITLLITDAIGLMLILDGQVGLAMMVIVAPFVVIFVFTKNGRRVIQDIQNEMEQEREKQQKASTSKKTQVCSDCGWQNPKANSFCHDCGTELG